MSEPVFPSTGEKLTSRQNCAILNGDGEYKPRGNADGYTIAIKRRLRQLGLLECKMTIDALFLYRLTDAGLKLQAYLLARAKGTPDAR